MNVFLDDIKKNTWLASRIMEQSWGSTFLNLKKGCFFVFNYNLIEESSSIKITSYQTLYQINDSIYMKMTASHVGYIQEPFESSNYLFYSILKSACTTKQEESKLTDLFILYKSQDIARSKADLKVSIKCMQDIGSSISFSNALTNIFSINKKPVHGLCMVYDLIEGFTQREYGKSIYGQMLTKIVRAVKNPNGGLLPEYADSSMRYLIIGEKAAKNDETLFRAKHLLRSGSRRYDIFLETGWYLNKYDNMWRKRISDDTFYFDEKSVSKGNGKSYVLPEGWDEDKFTKFVDKLVEGKTTLYKGIADGYDIKLKDYVSFEKAFELYPNLKDIYSLLSVDNLKDDRYSFYFSSQEPLSLVLITGVKNKYDLSKIQYVALHEMQHYIQNEEGFGNGGNENLANLIDSVGGNSVKMFYLSLSAFQKKFSEIATFIPIEKYKELLSKLSTSKYKDYKLRYKQRFIPVTLYYNQIIDKLRSSLESIETISQNTNDISYYILTLYSMIEETNPDISEFVKDNIGVEYIDFFKQALEQNKKTLEKDNQLTNKGWTPFDLYILNFQAYESLIGEVEARFTQQTSKMPKELQNYFEFYTSETIDSSKVKVISNSLLQDAGKNVEAALETYEGKYVIHLPEGFTNSINLLHETGHILFDFVKEGVLANVEFITNAANLNYSSVEEYFCASFVDYIHRKDIDPLLTQDLSSSRDIKSLTDFDSLFQSILYSETKVDVKEIIKRLDFVNKILEQL